MDVLVDRILGLGDDVFYKNRTGADRNLSDDAKRAELVDLLKNNKPAFLYRYGRIMEPDDCVVFATVSDEKPTTRMADPPTAKNASSVVVPANARQRNSRFLALQRLKVEGQFFSNYRMREREPYLFDQMIGRFMTDQSELRPTVANASGGWADMLERFEMSDSINQRRTYDEKMQWDDDPARRRKKEQFWAHVTNRFETERDEPEDDSSLGQSAVSTDESDRPCNSTMGLENVDSLKAEVNRIDKKREEGQANDEEMEEEEFDDSVDAEHLRQEFLSYMEERFLSGRDGAFFDYSTVDDGGMHDPIGDRDREERYFEEEDDE